MSPSQCHSLLAPAITSKSASWADIGAGTGTFTLVLRELLTAGTIYAVDKNPHMLWKLPLDGPVPIRVVEGDFNRALDIPPVDGILMANTLHYAEDPVAVLQNVLQYLKPDGAFVLIEYETDTPLHPWIPYPIPFDRFGEIAHSCGLTPPVELARVPTQYGHQHIYSSMTMRKKN